MTTAGGGVPTTLLPAVPWPAPGAAWPSYAGFGRRVVATLLDDALLAAVTWLAFPVQPVVAPTLLPWLRPAPGDAAPTTWPEAWWVVAALAAVVVLQGWTGSSPGKLVVGIAVVGNDARPVGVVMTVLRALCHVLDAVLLVGYLRVLWHPRRRTFADSIASTVVLSTRRPLPFAGLPFVAARRRAAGSTPQAPELPAAPAWRVRLTAAALTVCVGGVAMAVGPYSLSGGGSASSSCVVGAGGGPLTEATLTVRAATAPASRAGIVRSVRQPDAGVEVVWWSSGGLPPSATLRLVVAGAAGATRTWEHALVDGHVVSGEGVALEDGRAGILLPAAALDGLGPAWTWTASVEADDGAVSSCSAPGPGGLQT